MPVRSRIAIALMIATAPPLALADDAAELADLLQRVRILERKLEIRQEDAVAKAPTIPVVAVNDKGLSVKNQKGDFEFKLRGGLQFDHRAFFDDTPAVNDGFLFRRIFVTHSN